MEYYHHVSHRFSQPPARHVPSPLGYFHHHRAVFTPLRRDHVRLANGRYYGFLLPVAASVDSVWVVPVITGRHFPYIRAHGPRHVDGNLIFDDATIRQTRRSAPFVPSGRLRGGILEDDTWVLDSHDHSQDLPPEGAGLQAPSTSNNNIGSKEHCVSKFLETRTSEIMSGDEEICVVCQDDLGTDRIATLDCRHRYHAECIKTWLTLKNFCPICKAAALSTVDS